MSYSIDDGQGNLITAGLQGEQHARDTAQSLANRRGQSVYLYESGCEEDEFEEIEPSKPVGCHHTDEGAPDDCICHGYDCCSGPPVWARVELCSECFEKFCVVCGYLTPNCQRGC